MTTRSLLPWRLFRELEEPRNYFDTLFYRPILPFFWRHSPTAEREWLPAVEMYEKEDRYIVKAELPGLQDEDIEVTVQDGHLTIKGEKKCEAEHKEDEYHYCEVSYGSFQRTIGLPTNVKAEKVEASYADGVLEVTLPKVAEAKTKKIAVAGKKQTKAAN